MFDGLLISTLLITSSVSPHIQKTQPLSPQCKRNVKERLQEMVNRDQEARQKYFMIMNAQNVSEIKKILQLEYDLPNTQTLKTIIQVYGWPKESIFGKQASDNAWLIAQHADHDIEFQDKCLALLAKDTNTRNYAFLYDRVQVNRHRPQRYGTQLDHNHKPLLCEYEDARTDIERAKMGLEPLAHYLQFAAQCSGKH